MHLASLFSIEFLIFAYSLDIILATETWLNESVCDRSIELSVMAEHSVVGLLLVFPANPLMRLLLRSMNFNP